MLAESVGLRLRTGEVALAKVRGEWVAGAGGWGGEWEAGRKSPGRAYVWAGPGRCAPSAWPRPFWWKEDWGGGGPRRGGLGRGSGTYGCGIDGLFSALLHRHVAVLHAGLAVSAFCESMRAMSCADN